MVEEEPVEDKRHEGEEEEKKEPKEKKEKPLVELKEIAGDGVDKFVGKYRTADDLKIGDRDMSKLIDVCEKNNKKFQNVRKFEN